MSGFPIISVITFLPLFGAIVLIGFNAEQKKLARGLAFGFSIVALALTVFMWTRFNPASGDLQFVETYNWIPTLAAQYHVGVDGLGLLMVLLTAIIVPMAMLASWNIEERVPTHFALILFLQAGLFGTFSALNFFHWFIYWELSLIPAFFLIKLWGGPNRSSAATQFFVYTMVGSIAMLLSFLALYITLIHVQGVTVPTKMFDFATLADLANNGPLSSKFVVRLGWYSLSVPHLALMIFAGAFLGFAVKVPLVPFHTWLPSAYAEAPTGTTMLLTGVMSKMGVYGFIRIILPIFGEQLRWILTPLLWLTVITIVYSAGAAFAQRDLKRVLGYSSINHLGFCLLGVFAVARLGDNESVLASEKAAALNGVFLQLFNHGITAATLFWFVGFLEQRGSRGINDFGGLRKVAPVFCGLMGIALFSSLGLPGLNGFIGEFLIFKGAFPLTTWATSLSVIGLLITAIFILTILQRVFNGPLNEKWSRLPDLTLTERVLVLPSIALMFLLGIYPQLVLGVINSTAVQMISRLHP
jgi:NADH-quinone oxidoreductase subunit M